MKKLLLTIFSIWGIWSTLYAQTIKHHHYTTYYDVKIKEADSVSWDLTPDMVSCDPQVRKNVFKTDPLLPGSASPKDYVGTHYDLGHLFSYDDAQCDPIDKVECFFVSNMLPQVHPFNAGDWKVLEMKARIWARSQRLHIIAGGIGSIGKFPAGENIPAFMYKAIYINGHYMAWIMPNQPTSHGHKFDYWQVPISELDAKTGLKL
jgi:endonuclease G